MDVASLTVQPTPPTTLEENIAWRLRTLTDSNKRPDYQSLLLEMCHQDICGWFDGFVWTYDPRLDISPRPMILYDYQREDILDLQHAIRTGSDRLIEKSRDMGATWMVIGTFVHFWLFEQEHPFLIASRVEDLVDKRGDPDCLFWKAEYLVQALPIWMIPPYTRSHMHLGNHKTGSVIDGAAANQVGRGGRRRAIMLDESAQMVRGVDASTADTTNCRLFISTPHGVGNEFAEIRRANTLKTITMHWSRHPIKGKGAVKLPNGKWTSPWYEYECSRRASPRDIAQELDIDYLGSGDMFFDLTVLTRIEAEDTVDPPLRGDLVVKRNHDKPGAPIVSMGFVENPTAGNLKLWIPLDRKTNAPSQLHNYAIGCDISNGLGSSNSVAVIVDVNTGEKVAEYATADKSPEEFAGLVDALGRWAGGEVGMAYVAWESNGPGMVFGKRIIKHGYAHIHWHQREESQSPKRTRIPGWHSSRTTKELLLGEYRAALAKREMINRSVVAVHEAMEYIYYPSGGIGPSRLADDGSGARETHGDRVIADALAHRARVQQPRASPPKKIAPMHSVKRMLDEAEERDSLEGRWNE